MTEGERGSYVVRRDTGPVWLTTEEIEDVYRRAEAWDALVALLTDEGMAREWERGHVLAARGDLLVWVRRNAARRAS